MMKTDNGEYWHSEKLQAEYRNLIDGGLPASEVAEALGISEDMAVDFTTRVNTMTSEIGDTGELDSAFLGLSDTAQGYAVRVLADPTKREAYIDAMPVAVLEELADFVSHRMTDHEVSALEKALLL